MADKRPSVAGAFIALLGLGAVGAAIVAIALSFTASSAQRIQEADRNTAAVGLLEQRQIVTGLLAAELAGTVVDEISDADVTLATPLTARRVIAVETAATTAADLSSRGDSVGNEARRWLSALTMPTDPVEIEDAFQRLVAYDAFVDAACCVAITPSDDHYTDVLGDLEAVVATPSLPWDYFYIAVELDSHTPPPVPTAINRFLEHLGTPTRLAPDTDLPSITIATGLAAFADLGASQENINTLLAGDALETLDKIILGASGRSSTAVTVDEAFAAAESVSGAVDGLYAEALAATRADLTSDKDTAEQIRLIATVVTPILLLILIGIGFVIYRSARNREKVLARERDLLDARNRFMRMVSHELRTPATAISGFAQTLTSEWTTLTEAEISEFLTIVDRQSSHLALIVDDLLTLSHLETGRLRLHLGLVNLKQAADEAISMVDARYGIEIATAIDPEIMLLADSDRLVQILRNLVENAAKYGKTDVAVTATINGSECVVAVSDSGPGVPPDAAKRIFRFWDRGAHEGDQTRGHGMGLAIARHLAMAMVGDLIYQPHQPLGSEFVLTLPLGRPNVAPVETETSPRRIATAS